MKVLFIQDNGINESLALTELSGALRHSGHDTQLLLENDERDLFKSIEQVNADVFILPCSILAHNFPLRIARGLKERWPEKKVIFGGTHPTFYPDIINEGPVDAICLGEADLAMTELVDTLAAGGDISKLQNFHVKMPDGSVVQNELRPLVQDFDAMPMPHRELYYHYGYIRKFKWKKFMSGRGCVHSCTYCYQPTFRQMYHGAGKYIRLKSAGRMVDEVAHVKKISPLKIAHFCDDVFTYKAEWLEEFADQFKARVGIPFTCNTSVELLNERKLAALKKGGCRAIAIGVETGIEENRNRILNKTVSNAEILEKANMIKKAGIVLVTFNMIANPGETIQEAMKTMELNAKMGTDYIRLQFAVPIPKTVFAERGVEDGYLDAEQVADIYNMPDFGSGGRRPVFKTNEANEFVNLLSLFRLGVKFPWAMGLIKALIKLPPNPIFKLGNLMELYTEKKMFNLELLDGFRYFLHVGSPGKRTTNFASMI